MVSVDALDMTGATQGFQPADMGADEGVRVAMTLLNDVSRRFQVQARPVDAAIGSATIWMLTSAGLGSALVATESSATIWPRLISSRRAASAVST